MYVLHLFALYERNLCAESSLNYAVNLLTKLNANRSKTRSQMLLNSQQNIQELTGQLIRTCTRIVHELTVKCCAKTQSKIAG